MQHYRCGGDAPMSQLRNFLSNVVTAAVSMPMLAFWLAIAAIMLVFMWCILGGM